MKQLLESDIDTQYGVLMEGRLDLMYLPAGAVAWLWKYNRPEMQAETASQAAQLAHSMGDPIDTATLLRADHNVLVIHTTNGLKFSIYPDGGMGCNGEPVNVANLASFLGGISDPAMTDIAVDPLPDDLVPADPGAEASILDVEPGLEPDAALVGEPQFITQQELLDYAT